ncbi:hypothetical protein [Xenorhabdus sp. SGI240]|uniref:hypothetical protein n=1 Tax=Xenorhabdus sp. SGI240 TaxID=3158262 RepID=UPI0032B6FEF3
MADTQLTQTRLKFTFLIASGTQRLVNIHPVRLITVLADSEGEAHPQEQSLTGRDRLAIRTGVAQTLQAKERHRCRMTAPTYQWMKPAPKR